MKLIDTHCHVNFHAYKEDADEVIRRSLDAGIFMINVGSQSTTSQKAVEQARQYDGVWAAVGLHPNHLCEQEFTDPDEADETATVKTRCETFDPKYYRQLAKDPKVVGIGEFGLDYYRIPDTLTGVIPQTSRSDKRKLVMTKQKEVMRQQLDLADELDLPVIIHSRDSHADQIEILTEYVKAGKLSRRGVIHCFTGTLEEANKYFELGFLISFTGIICFPPKKNESFSLADVVRQAPLDKIMIETDAPYLAPPPYRGKRNEPSYVRYVAEKIAQLKEISVEEVAQTTNQNAQNLFGIKI